MTSACDAQAVTLLRVALEQLTDRSGPQVVIVLVPDPETAESSYAAEIVDLARAYGVPVEYLPVPVRVPSTPDVPKGEERWRLEHEQRLVTSLRDYQPDVLMLAGYMLIAGPYLRERFPMLNLHPALPGVKSGTQDDVVRHLLATRPAQAGAMVHLVTEVLDGGPPVEVAKFDIASLPPDGSDIWSDDSGAQDSTIRDAIRSREPQLVVNALRRIQSEGLPVVPRRWFGRARSGAIDRTGVLAVFDMEGPLTPADFALELFSSVIADGDFLYSVISKYDDILALDLRRVEYEPGDTLALILPFLVAHGLSHEMVESQAERSRKIMSGSSELMEHCHGDGGRVGVITTAYQPFAHKITDDLGLPRARVYSTELPLSFDGIVPDSARSAVIELERRMALDLGEEDLSSESGDRVVAVLDAIFSVSLPSLGVPYPTQTVRPRGGTRKVSAIIELCSDLSVNPRDIIYVGDSITDVAAFRFVDAAGGLAVSFNGNAFAVNECTVAVASPNLFTGVGPIVDAWVEGRRSAVVSLLAGFDAAWLWGASHDQRRAVVERHSRVRQAVRKAAGALG